MQQSVEATVEWLTTHIRRLLDAMRDQAGVATSKIREWLNALAEGAAPGGVGSALGGAGLTAGLAGIRAALTGKNPVWAAIRGLVSGLSGKAEIALVLLLILALVLGPVVLVVLLLALLVAVLVAAVRAAVE